MLLDIAILNNKDAYDDELAETWEKVKEQYNTIKNRFDKFKIDMDKYIKKGER